VVGKRILDGIKVLDLSRILAGPWCTQALADMGAEVFKIERPGSGDEMRASPPFLVDRDGNKTLDTPSYVCVNRGKHSLTIDMSRPEGQRVLRDLALRCDILVENFKAGDLKRYGLDWETLREAHPRLIYCSITGYGQDGPMASWPGYDPVLQAVSGIMSTCGIPDGKPGEGPMRAMVPFIDVMTGMVATGAITAALYHRERTGEGQQLDLALLDVAVAATNHLSQNYLSTGRQPVRVGNGSLIFGPSNCYPAIGGWVLIQAGNDGQWRRLCQVLGREAWLTDGRFATNAARMAHAAELDREIEAVTRTLDQQDIARRLGEAGVPCGPVNTLAQAFEHPQVVHRGLRALVPHPAHGDMPVVRSPYRFSATPVDLRAPPVLGADTEGVLSRELGLDGAAIDGLRKAGAL
jgi:crotonobetainyl-CoA:carnitine CoA-transferase CaiB-like acyl-CoA transferase